MSLSAARDSTARKGADSVFRYLSRTAAPTSSGASWEQFDNAGNPKVRGDLYASGGIALFLASYYQVTGDGRALSLGLDAARWCSAPDREFLGDRLWPNNTSLVYGRSAPGLAWLRLAEVGTSTVRDEALRHTAAVGNHLAECDSHPAGAFNDIAWGAAGEGTFLARLFRHTGEERHLEGARRRGEWIAEQTVRDGARSHWPQRRGDSGPPRTSLLNGIAGVAYFLLDLYQTTGDVRWAEAALDGAAALESDARPDRGGLNWLPLYGADYDQDLSWKRVPIAKPLTHCQWCNGAPGIGLFFAKAFDVLGDHRFLEIACAAAEATYAYGDGRANPTYCHGLAGGAELLVELCRITADALWNDRAHDFARRMMAYRAEGQSGDSWPSDNPPHPAPDFLCGAAGVGHTFLRILDPRVVPVALP